MKEGLKAVLDMFGTLCALVERGKPVAFYGYTSCVTGKQGVNIADACDHVVYYHYMMVSMVKIFNLAGIPCAPDNKIVFEWLYNDKVLFVGFYDGRLSIGQTMRKW